MIAKSMVIKDRGGKSGGRAVKAVDHTSGKNAAAAGRVRARYSSVLPINGSLRIQFEPARTEAAS